MKFDNKKQKEIKFVPYHNDFKNTKFLELNFKSWKFVDEVTKETQGEIVPQTKENERKENCNSGDCKSFSFWRNMEIKNYDDYYSNLIKGFPVENIKDKTEIEKGVSLGQYEALTRLCRAKIDTALKRGKAKIRHGIVVGCMEPRQFDSFFSKQNGERSLFTYTKKRKFMSDKKVCVIKYKWNKYNNGLPKLGSSDAWSHKHHVHTEFVNNVEIVENRYFIVTDVTLTLNSHTWEIKLAFKWHSKIKVVNGEKIGLSSKEIYVS
jgi:hypothetical protein